MEYTQEQVSEAMEGLPALWVLKHKIKTEAGFPIEFTKRKFLWDMYNDLSPKQCEMKPPQIGLTVKAIVKTFWVAKKLGRDIIYTLPTQGDVEDMAGDKINRIVAQNPILGQWIKEHDTVAQKSVGSNLIHYRGTFTSKQAMMVSSGLNVHDEVDVSDPAVINQYETRLEGQDNEEMKWRWYFSHPSLAGHGVDVYWQQSDKKEWYITCPQCLKEQVLSWPVNIDIEKGIYICSLCKLPLTDEARIDGLWKNQDGVAWNGSIVGNYLFSGWHVSQLMLWNKKAVDIIRAFNDPLKNKQYFYNYILGLPYIGGDDVISPQTVLKNCVAEVNDQSSRIIIGVDTGLPIHYVCLNKDGVFYYNTCENYNELEKLLNRWPKAVLVSDQGGDLIGIRQLQQKFSGRVFLCYYRKDRKSQEVITWGEHEKYGEVVVDRNNMLTLIVEQLRDLGRLRLNGSPEEWQEFANHFGNIYREKVVVKETKDKDDRSLYGNEYVWKRNGADHFVHSLLYALVGLSKYGESLATIVSKTSNLAPKGINVGSSTFGDVMLSDF